MVIKRRIETQEAKALRSKRQHFAAPGGSHDKLIGFLARALPMGVGVVAALMIITPLSPRGEVSFLLDRNEVAVINERLSVDNAMYRGRDNRGRPFSITAGEAVQRSSSRSIRRARVWPRPTPSARFGSGTRNWGRRLWPLANTRVHPTCSNLIRAGTGWYRQEAPS